MMYTPQKTALFNPLNGHLEQLFGYIDMGDLGLPDIQRPFVWKDAKVRDLFDSLYKGFPIGSYLLWRNTAGGRTHQIGSKARDHGDPNMLIIDGQQRLTALYSVFRGEAVKDDDYEDRVITISFNPITEEFRVADAATQRNPEFLNNITELFTKSSTRTFINTYLERFRKEKDGLAKKYDVLIEKIAEKQVLNKGDVELLGDKAKNPNLSDAHASVFAKIGLLGTSVVENGEEEAEERDSDEEKDIVEVVNEEMALLSAEELEIIKAGLSQEDAIDEELISSRIEKLYNMKKYPFNALEIVPDLTEETVADIFTRINSKGTVLKQADFILTLISVFWREGRSQIDQFCKSESSVRMKSACFNTVPLL